MVFTESLNLVFADEGAELIVFFDGRVVRENVKEAIVF